MKTSIFAAAALLGAVNGAAVARDSCPSKQPLPCGATQSRNHIIQAGETLTTISAKEVDANGKKLAGICDIAKANNLANINYIVTGNNLIIPECTQPIDDTTCNPPVTPAPASCAVGPPDYYTVEKGDWLSKIAGDFVITLESLEAANPAITNPDLIFPGQKLNITVCQGSTCAGPDNYTIKSGDTFFLLSQQFKTSVGALKALNPQVNVSDIAVGQVIQYYHDCKNATA